jgi:hypothetical protein
MYTYINIYKYTYTKYFEGFKGDVADSDDVYTEMNDEHMRDINGAVEIIILIYIHINIYIYMYMYVYLFIYR